MSSIKSLHVLFLLSLLLSGCDEKTYDYGFREGGIGGPGWPIWVEYLIINEARQVPVGSLSGGTGDVSKRPPGGASANVGWIPLPHSVQARWFSYRNQTFYEATVEIPKQKQKQIKQSLKKYGTEKYLQDLSVGFAGQGEIQLWWYASCVGLGCPEGPKNFEFHFFELTPRIKATVAEGDVHIYSADTREQVRTGFLPPEVLDLIPPRPDKADSVETK
ncbi:DUF2931 family protein [Gynuella sunshinyii]|uniref:Uncharacterized protein n=1 Tax=Gynuella sunshinyii YC6258 TaxID=1445510 RepID=A0A0C5VC58_9GAMM|nr:DUF2931 family protein [Gynuella sunshinyii]AJQ96940.1 hypothetical Protein YC6258_04908 [Gynuella sunshinyii YC6258]